MPVDWQLAGGNKVGVAVERHDGMAYIRVDSRCDRDDELIPLANYDPDSASI